MYGPTLHREDTSCVLSFMASRLHWVCRDSFRNTDPRPCVGSAYSRLSSESWKRRTSATWRWSGPRRGQVVSPWRLHLWGVRDLDPGERELLSVLGVDVQHVSAMRAEWPRLLGG